ncbi:MAG: helix-turn-helix domain-containing protein [Deltaproteobacteria bacterium]|nr:helix-turn-helix domain-containing protein [Deltaproteobacteria bacterium]
MPETVYTVEEAAVLLKLKPSTIRTYCRDDRIPCIRFGTNYRIRESTINKLIAGTLKVGPKRK